MDRLKRILNEHGRWAPVGIYIERINAHVEIDFSTSIENAKALLEAIAKEVCKVHSVELASTASMSQVLKSAFVAMGYSKRELEAQVSTSLSNIGQMLGDLRSEIGATAHGRTMDEIEARNSKVNGFTRDFLIDSVELVSCFMINCFENAQGAAPQVEAEPELAYDEQSEFNEMWDDMHGEFSMGDYSYSASEILFNVDLKAYRYELNAFVTEPNEQADGG